MLKNDEDASNCRGQREHRALTALISLSFAATLGVGCSGEGFAEEVVPNDATEETANDPTENALIESHLQAQGYDTSTLHFDGDTVIVEDDIAMSRSALLARAEAETTGLVDKGYFHTTGVFAGKRIQLSFGSGVSDAWKNALTAAQGEWNGKTPMFIREPGAAATINVVVERLTRNNRPDTGTIAIGFIPPQRTIKLNLNYDSNTCGGSLEAVPNKKYVAMHEMGHVLGFAHPPPNPTNEARTHIAGTLTSTTSGTTPSYATVMAQGCPPINTLMPDDIKSAGVKYPSCLYTCETNCTFNDPAQIGPCMAACPSQCR